MVKQEDLPKVAGTWIEADLHLLDAVLAPDTKIIVGGDWSTARPASLLYHCFLCRCAIALSRKDLPTLKQHPTICKLCKTCFFKLQAEEKKSE